MELPTTEQEPKQRKQKSTAIDNYIDFEASVKHAQLEDIEYLEVTQKLMEKLMKDSEVESITYGKPGVRVFVEGARERILGQEALSTEEFRELEIKKAQEKRKKALR